MKPSESSVSDFIDPRLTSAEWKELGRLILTACIVWGLIGYFLVKAQDLL